MTVGAEISQWGTGVLPIVSVATSDPKLVFYPIRDRFVTYWDPATARSIGSDLFADENGKKRRQRIKLDHQTGSATVTKQKDGQEPQESTHQVQPGTADVAAAKSERKRKFRNCMWLVPSVGSGFSLTSTG